MPSRVATHKTSVISATHRTLLEVEAVTPPDWLPLQEARIYTAPLCMACRRSSRQLLQQSTTPRILLTSAVLITCLHPRLMRLQLLRTTTATGTTRLPPATQCNNSSTPHHSIIRSMDSLWQAIKKCEQHNRPQSSTRTSRIQEVIRISWRQAMIWAMGVRAPRNRMITLKTTISFTKECRKWSWELSTQWVELELAELLRQVKILAGKEVATSERTFKLQTFNFENTFKHAIWAKNLIYIKSIKATAAICTHWQHSRLLRSENFNYLISVLELFNIAYNKINFRF